ncbi:MAG: helix-turn-helix transcriptional regulator, partial [Burkholderiales bacterium]|nr:helix-turn-helix transcriptional regulator [Burkholderiales bacterium]
RQCASAHLLCMRRETMHLLPSHSGNFIAVRFKIGALHRFIPIPTDLLADQSVPLDTIWGSAIDTLMQRISYAASQHERCMLIQDFLIQRLRAEAIDALVEQALQQLYQDSTTLSIQALADRFALGRRQLERRFQKLTGQTPREIKSAIRFQRSLRELMLQQHAHPTDIALANGYYDQAHFIHEFRQFTRQTPKQYLAEARTKTHFYNTSRSQPGNMSSPVELI